MSALELAQFNIAVMKAPLGSPEIVDFVANLDRINALAESAPHNSAAHAGTGRTAIPARQDA